MKFLTDQWKNAAIRRHVANGLDLQLIRIHEKYRENFTRDYLNMRDSPDIRSKSLGADLRALRHARGMTLTVLADRLGRSVGWVSQIERNLSHPSIEDLHLIAQVFEVPILLFFGQSDAPEAEQGYVVRKGARRKIGSDEAGLIEEMLSPDLTDDFEVVHSVFQPGARLSKPSLRPTQEVGYLISGKLDLTIGGREFTVCSGDSFRIRGEAHSWANPYNTSAVAIWVIAPPVY